MERFGISYEVSLDDFHSLVTSVHRRDQHVIIERESLKILRMTIFLSEKWLRSMMSRSRFFISTRWECGMMSRP